LVLVFLLFSLSLPRPPSSPPFPYTTLFRSIVTVFYLANLMGASFSSRTGVWLLALMLIGFSVFIMTGFGHIEWNAYPEPLPNGLDRKSTRLNSSHVSISYAVFCWKKKTLSH